MSEIGPFEALMLLCSYEEQMKETINPKKLESGELKLSDLLTKEDFDMARLVCTFSSNYSILQTPYLNSVFCLDFNSLSLPKYHLFNSFSSCLLLQPAFSHQNRLIPASPQSSHGYIYCTLCN